LTLIDTNVLIDVLVSDPTWRLWSAEMLERRSGQGPLLISDIVYAELSSRFEAEEELDSAIEDLEVTLQRIPKQGLFLAGRVFREYRRAGGAHSSVLADFFIGAHAQIEGIPILTRDTRRYRSYFPDVELIAPEA
jgi:predicted nucleic acid-binding protein